MFTDNRTDLLGAIVSTSSVAYCYDNADRLTSTATVNAAAGAAPVSIQSLALGTSLAYDSHGNTTVLADQTMTYDVSDQHISTTVGGETVSYDRNVSGAIVQRSSTDDPFATVRYTAGAVLNASGGIIQRTVSLPGGVSVTFTPAAVPQDPDVQAWFYPNLHGDVIVQADSAGVRQGVRSRFDPFGQSIHSATGDIGTEDADNAVQDTTPGDADYAFVGGRGKLYEHAGSIATVEMGARQYVAALGRFLEVDPIEGGVSNAYDYPADPINKMDLTGEFAWFAVFAIIAIVVFVATSFTSDSTQKPKPGPHNPFPFPDPTRAGSLGAAPGSDPCATRPCTSNKGGVSLCSNGRCIGGSFSFREDKHVLFTANHGPGVGVDFLATVGQSINESAGGSVTQLCGGAFGYGVYEELSATLPAPGSAPSSSGGVGYAFGGGAACGAGPAWTWDLGIPDWAK